MPRLTQSLALVTTAALLTACQQTPPAAPAPSLPTALQPPAGQVFWRNVPARGVQVYDCKAKADGSGATEWVFVAPEAELQDAEGRWSGKHDAGPHWEARDGSKIKGSVKARADAPQAGAIAWLLLATESVGPAGIYAKVMSIQRVNTVGGVAPAGGCTAGQQQRVPYTADYRMFTAG